MNRCMNEKSSQTRGSSNVSADNISFEIDQNHVLDFEQSKMNAQWVGSEGIWKLGVSNGNMATHALDILLSMPISRCGYHVSMLPLALGGEVHKLWDYLHFHLPVAQCFQGCLIFEFMSVIGMLRLSREGRSWVLFVLARRGLQRNDISS